MLPDSIEYVASKIDEYIEENYVHRMNEQVVARMKIISEQVHHLIPYIEMAEKVYSSQINEQNFIDWFDQHHTSKPRELDHDN